MYPPSQESPALNPDGTVTALVAGSSLALGEQTFLRLRLPSSLLEKPAGPAGHFFLARCGAQSEWERAERWDLYWRRALFPIQKLPTSDHPHPPGNSADAGTPWLMALPTPAHPLSQSSLDDPGCAWLVRQPMGSAVNLLGPLGSGCELAATTRHLLIVSAPRHLARTVPIAAQMLDREGMVSLLIDQPAGAGLDWSGQLRQLLPLPVEVHVAHDRAAWETQLDALLPWADQLFGAVASARYAALASQIRARRFVLEPGFAQMQVEATLACGSGGCLACVVPLPGGGYTRACVQGPVIDLARLVGPA